VVNWVAVARSYWRAPWGVERLDRPTMGRKRTLGPVPANVRSSWWISTAAWMAAIGHWLAAVGQGCAGELGGHIIRPDRMS